MFDDNSLSHEIAKSPYISNYHGTIQWHYLPLTTWSIVVIWAHTLFNYIYVNIHCKTLLPLSRNVKQAYSKGWSGGTVHWNVRNLPSVLQLELEIHVAPSVKCVFIRVQSGIYMLEGPLLKFSCSINIYRCVSSTNYYILFLELISISA